MAIFFVCRKGGGGAELDAMYDALKPIIDRYMGRHTWFLWVKQQFFEACVLGKEVTPYPDFVQQRIATCALDVSPSATTAEGKGDDVRAHTRLFLASYEAGTPTVPEQYFTKMQEG